MLVAMLDVDRGVVKGMSSTKEIRGACRIAVPPTGKKRALAQVCQASRGRLMGCITAQHKFVPVEGRYPGLGDMRAMYSTIVLYLSDRACHALATITMHPSYSSTHSNKCKVHCILWL